MIEIAREKLLDMYRTMVRIRTFEETVKGLFAGGGIPGFVHRYSGEEAVATGACTNLRPNKTLTLVSKVPELIC